MKQRTKKRLCLALIATAALLLTAAGLLYWYSRPAPPPTFNFLTAHQPCHEYIWKKESSAGVLTVYSFPAYHSSIYHAARRELIPLGYTEITPPIDYDSTGHRFDPRDRNVASAFEKQTGRTRLNIRIAKGRFLQAQPDGSMRFAADLDWVNVSITHSRQPFSLKRTWQNWWKKRPTNPKPSQI